MKLPETEHEKKLLIEQALGCLSKMHNASLQLKSFNNGYEIVSIVPGFPHAIAVDIYSGLPPIGLLPTAMFNSIDGLFNAMFNACTCVLVGLNHDNMPMVLNIKHDLGKTLEEVIVNCDLHANGR